MDNNFRDILLRQKQTADLLEAEIKRIENLDLTKKNSELEKQAERLNSELAELSEKIKRLAKANAELRDALHAKMYAEKFEIIKRSHKSMNTYFAGANEAAGNRLENFENHYKRVIDGKFAELHTAETTMNAGLTARINLKYNELRQEIDAELARAWEAQAQATAVKDEMQAGYTQFYNEGIPERDLQNVAKQSSFERILGLNILNKIGIVLILIGAIAATQYAYTRIPDAARSLLIFALGLLMIGFGEFLSRKKANVFSIGITAGGVAVTYAALAVSYFTLGILTVLPAVSLCVLITAGAFSLSLRHKSQVIATFAVIGGFLPLLAIDDALSFEQTIPGMAYFIALGIFILILSFKQKWIVTAFFGLSFNIIATFHVSSFFESSDPVLHKAILIGYIVVSFVIYTLMPVISTYIGKLNFRKSDIVLLAINGFFSTIVLYGVFAKLDLSDFHGSVAAVLLVAYTALFIFLSKKMPAQKDMAMLFFIAAVVFFALIIPMQFDVVWLSLGWLLQGVGLAVFGIIKEKRRFTISGLIIGGLCLIIFIFSDLFFTTEHFEWKFFAITAGALIIMSAFAYKKRDTAVVKAFKYCTILNLWVFLLYIISRGFDTFVYGNLNRFDSDYLLFASSITVTFALAFLIQRIKPVSDMGVVIITRVFYSFGIFMLLILNGTQRPLLSQEIPYPGLEVLASALLITINALSMFALYDMLKVITRKSALRAEWLPFILSLFFTFILTQNLIVYYNVKFAGMTISVIYAGLAVAWCIFGFWKRFTFMRRFGLVTALLAVGKVFLIDLWALTEGYRIITFFALGVSLIGISFVYQYFTKQIEDKA